MSDTPHTIPDHIATRVSRLINEAEDMRQQAADDLKQIYADLREELRGMGWTGAVVSAEVAALKGAISELRLDDEKKAKREEKGERVLDYVSLLSRARAREGRSYADAKLVETVVKGVQTEVGRKALVSAIDAMIERESASEEFPPHDPVTGELADEEQPETAEQVSPAPERKTAGSAPRETGGEGANAGGDDVDGSASARPSGQEFGAEPRGVDRGVDVEFVERNTSGPDAKRAPNSTGSAARGQAALSGECPEAPPTDEARKGPSGTAAPIRSPAITAGAGGHRSIPRPDARVAGRGEAATSSVADAQSDQAVTHSKADDFDIGDVPAFLRRTDGYAAAAGRAEP